LVKYKSFSQFLPLIRAANQKIVLSGLALDNQVKTILMLDKLPSQFHSFKTNVSMNFKSEAFETILKKLEDFAAQNQLNDYRKNDTLVQTMFTRANDPDIVCPHCKQGFCACSHCFKSGHTKNNCFQKHPNKQHTKSAPASSSKQNSTHLTQYTEEDEENLEYLQQKYPDLHM
jgi:hypothetical protein